MKKGRHAAILEIIDAKDVETQEGLLFELKRRGYEVTQATISRDIKELRLVKSLSDQGVYKYVTVEKADKGILNRFYRMFSESVLTIESSSNLIVIKTITGSANAAASTVDSLKWPEVLGTIAGDDTILVIARDERGVAELMARFRDMMQ